MVKSSGAMRQTGSHGDEQWSVKLVGLRDTAGRGTGPSCSLGLLSGTAGWRWRPNPLSGL